MLLRYPPCINAVYIRPACQDHVSVFTVVCTLSTSGITIDKFQTEILGYIGVFSELQTNIYVSYFKLPRMTLLRAGKRSSFSSGPCCSLSAAQFSQLRLVQKLKLTIFSCLLLRMYPSTPGYMTRFKPATHPLQT